MNSGGGAKAGNNRGSIPSNVRKMIQNIKEIAGSHSDEDIHAMLKECSMDPNETAQKLLLQDTFHEVRRKRDRKKENPSKDPAEPRWKPGMQGRGNRGGRGSHPSRSMSYDATADGRNSSGKDNAPNQDSEKAVTAPISSSENKSKEAVTSLSTVKANGPTSSASESMVIMHDNNTPLYSGKSAEQLAPSQANMKSSGGGSGNVRENRQQIADSSDCSTSIALGAQFLLPEAVPSPSQDSHLSGGVDASKEGVVIKQLGAEQVSANTGMSKSIDGFSETGSSSIQEKVPSKSHANAKNQPSDISQTTSLLHTNPSGSRPSSNYGSGSRLEVIGQQKVGPSKEWKPKSTIPNLTQGSVAATSSEASTISVEANTKLPAALDAPDSKEVNVELQKRLEELRVSGGQQHVIFPNHVHVPEVEKLGFRFGSFDTDFGAETNINSSTEHVETPPISETSGGSEEATEEQFSSNQNASGAVDEANYPENSQLSSYGTENLLPSDGGVSSSSVPEFNEAKQETVPEGNEYPGPHSSNYGFGFMPPVLGSQLPPIESPENQPRDVSRLPTYVVQQPFDPTNYYAQFYRPGADSDGRISPFHSAATKYNGNMNMLSPQTSQSPQEVGNPGVLSTGAPTLESPAAGVMQSSMGVTTQPLFRPPAALHLPHYPTNYFPYHYMSPFIIPPPGIHQYVANGAFPQQPQGANVYPAMQGAPAKYSVLQYKPGTNPNNSGHIGMPGYVTYSSPVVTYNLSSSAAAGNSTSNEDLAAHFKDNNTYTSGQQSEGSGVWIGPPGRDISSVQASSFYNIPQGQMAFAPAQPGHGTFAGLYHPAPPVNPATVHSLLQQQQSQTMASPVDMVGPAGNVYQQPQHSQINWPNNF